MVIVRYSNESLEHSGIKGQKWGVRRYQNPDGSLTPEGRRRYGVGEFLRDDIRRSYTYQVGSAVKKVADRDIRRSKSLKKARKFVRDDIARTKRDAKAVKAFVRNDLNQTKKDIDSAKRFINNDIKQTKKDIKSAKKYISKDVRNSYTYAASSAFRNAVANDAATARSYYDDLMKIHGKRTSH